ncbi:hypothetical protein PVAP13_6KG317700 [Panicum virgatum]|uniref:Uncharacterized protein n=1 Tax=Panicum virgatum TaxID=38727 RepID=A0A8T0RHH8_PANVG|nr:hypothetical protein PVAP13_6KG317700 [Panicum virgatum]
MKHPVSIPTPRPVPSRPVPARPVPAYFRRRPSVASAQPANRKTPARKIRHRPLRNPSRGPPTDGPDAQQRPSRAAHLPAFRFLCARAAARRAGEPRRQPATDPTRPQPAGRLRRQGEANPGKLCRRGWRPGRLPLRLSLPTHLLLTSPRHRLRTNLPSPVRPLEVPRPDREASQPATPPPPVRSSPSSPLPRGAPARL